MGGMEDMGLISLRENELIVADPKATKAPPNVGLALAHELAHLWFGDVGN